MGLETVGRKVVQVSSAQGTGACCFNATLIAASVTSNH
jgi:hypothetical protein